MTPQEIGLVYNELRTRRVLFGTVIPGRRRSEGEIAAVAILRRCAGRFGDIDDFLATQGLKLVVGDALAWGLPGTGEIYIAIRNPLVAPPEHVRGEQIVRALIDGRRDETPEQVAVWSVFLTLLLLDALYTREQRPIESVSAFKDSIVDVEEFCDTVRRRVEDLRGAPVPGDTSRRAVIRDTLTGLPEQRLEGRVRSFFKAMVDLGVLERVENVALEIEGQTEPAYRQTLWSAVDLAHNFKRYAPHLLIEDAAEAVDAAGSETPAIDAADPVDEEERDLGEGDGDEPRGEED